MHWEESLCDGYYAYHRGLHLSYLEKENRAWHWYVHRGVRLLRRGTASQGPGAREKAEEEAGEILRARRSRLSKGA